MHDVCHFVQFIFNFDLAHWYIYIWYFSKISSWKKNSLETCLNLWKRKRKVNLFSLFCWDPWQESHFLTDWAMQKRNCNLSSDVSSSENKLLILKSALASSEKNESIFSCRNLGWKNRDVFKHEFSLISFQSLPSQLVNKEEKKWYQVLVFMTALKWFCNLLLKSNKKEIF